MWKRSFGFDLQVQDFYSETYNRRLSILTNSGKTDNGFSDFEMEVESRLWKSVLIKWPWAAHSASLILPVRQDSWNIYLYQSLNGKWNLENKKINSFLPESLCLALIDREFSLTCPCVQDFWVQKKSSASRLMVLRRTENCSLLCKRWFFF